jgi:hypothetical protein
MIKSARLLVTIYAFSTIIAGNCLAADYGGQWKVTSIKLCRTSSGALSSGVEAIGNYPVYTFFIPRPVWTVNGAVVDAQPVYDRGKLVSFSLLGGATLLKSGTKNTVKFALPDHSGSKIFYFDVNKLPMGECYELF